MVYALFAVIYLQYGRRDCQELFLENVESERQMPVTLYSAVVVLVV